MALKRVIRDEDGQITAIEEPDRTTPPQPDPSLTAISAGLTQNAADKLLAVSEGLATAAQRFAEASGRDLDAIREAEAARWGALWQQRQAVAAMREAHATTSSALTAVRAAAARAAETEDFAEVLLECAVCWAFREGTKQGIELMGASVSPDFVVPLTDESVGQLLTRFQQTVEVVAASERQRAAQRSRSRAVA